MKRLLKILENLHPDVDFRGSVHLVEDGILDSFDVVALVAEIEEEYGVVIPADRLVPENFDSAMQIFRLIEELKQ